MRHVDWSLVVWRGGTDLRQCKLVVVASKVRFEIFASAGGASPASRPAFSLMIFLSTSLPSSMTSSSQCPTPIRTLNHLSPP